MIKNNAVANQSQPLVAGPFAGPFADPLALCQIQEGYYNQDLSVIPPYEVRAFLTKDPEAPSGANPPQPIKRHIAMTFDELSNQTQYCLKKSLIYLAENEQYVNAVRSHRSTATVLKLKGGNNEFPFHFQLTFDKSIEGACSYVYYACFDAQNPPKNPNRRDVVIKAATYNRDLVIKVAQHDIDEDDWVTDQFGDAQFKVSQLYLTVGMLIDEINIHSSLSAHPNIIPLLGFSYLGYLPKEKRSIIDTFAIFPKYDDDAREFFVNCKRVNYMIRFLYQIMEGLIFLQDKNIVHQDIKLENCFIQSNGFHCVVADFGGAISLEKNQTMKASCNKGCTVDNFSPERLIPPYEINHTLDTVGWAFMISDLYCLIAGPSYTKTEELTKKFCFNNDYFVEVEHLNRFMRDTQDPQLTHGKNDKFDKELEILRMIFKYKIGSEAIYQYCQQSSAVNTPHRLAFILAPCFVSVIQKEVDQRASKEALLEFLKPMTRHLLASIT